MQARKRLLKASYQAGLAFSRSYVGYVHAIAHSLGGKYNMAHGLANAIILPKVLKSYGKSIYNKMYKIAKFLDLCDGKTTKQEARIIVNAKMQPHYTCLMEQKTNIYT